MPTPRPCRRGVVFALVLLIRCTSSGAKAQPVFCADPNPFVIEIENLDGDSRGSVCFATFFECTAPISQGPSLGLTDPSCDPTLEACSVTLKVPFEFPGTEENIRDAGSASAAPTRRQESLEIQAKAERERFCGSEPALSHVTPPTVINVWPKSLVNKGVPETPQIVMAPQVSVGVGVQSGGWAVSK